jgi:hypothetical protein
MIEFLPGFLIRTVGHAAIAYVQIQDITTVYWIQAELISWPTAGVPAQSHL